MRLLAQAQIRAFAERGYPVVPGLVTAPDLERADAEVHRLIAGLLLPAATPAITSTGPARPGRRCSLTS